MPRPKKSAAVKESSKAELIRQTAQTIGKSAKAGQIVAALKEQGIVVQYGQVRRLGVSGSGRKRRRGKAVTKVAGGDKGGAVSKAERIRQTAKTLGRRVRPREIIAELAKEGITVSSTLVSKTLASAGFRRRRRRQKVGTSADARQAARGGGSLDLDALLAAKTLIEKVGGIENAQAALSTLKRLQ